jgi:hypothetical protein
MTSDFLRGLDPEETFALRARLQEACRMSGDPRVRIIPPSLYIDIAQSLYLLELAARHSVEIVND